MVDYTNPLQSRRHDPRDQLFGTGHSLSSQSLGTPFVRPVKTYSLKVTGPPGTMRIQQVRKGRNPLTSILNIVVLFTVHRDNGDPRSRVSLHPDDDRSLNSTLIPLTRPLCQSLLDGSLFLISVPGDAFCQTDELMCFSSRSSVY